MATSPFLLFLLIRSINVSDLKLIRNTLLLIIHKGCTLPSSWFNWKCHRPVSCYKSICTASWWCPHVQVTVLTLPHLLLCEDTLPTQILWERCGPSFVPWFFTPCLFPSYNSLQTLRGYTSTPFLYSQKSPTTSLPTLSLINNDPTCLFKGLLSPCKPSRENVQLILL